MHDTVGNVEIDLRTDFTITDSGLATLDDIEELQGVSPDGYTGLNEPVVVMDSGIDETHAVFDGVEVEHVDIVGDTADATDNVGHGTACAGTIVRLAPDVDLISLRIFGDSGRTSGDVIVDAYRWLIENSDRYSVVNMSWGAQQKVQQLDNLHNRLVDEGVYPVVAAGNTGSKGGSPATAEKAFSVGAVDADGELTRFSSYNPNYDNPDVCGIGKNNRLPRASGTSMGTVLDDEWVKASGTSFSAPILSAFVAQALEAKGDFALSKLYESTATDIKGTPEDGAGIAMYDASMAADSPEPSKPTVQGSAWNFAGHDTMYIGADWIHTGPVTITKVDEDDEKIVLEVVQEK